MKKLLLVLTVAGAACAPQEAANPEVAAWEEQAQRVTIIRDDWGIPHIYGETDADAVFGLMYAQAEDDFNRVEVNFLNSMGRLAEAEGAEEIYRDLRMRLFIDPAEIQQMYADSPDWLKGLMDAWAAGLNYFLHTHPEVTPKVLDRFEPWMALTFSEGSIGGDIERVSLNQLQAFYGDRPENMAMAPEGEESLIPPEPTGSNGIAIAPTNTEAGHALLLINPHTSFYFRSEVHVVSEEGLDAYGAVTWGQFFVYQGFNENAGWMHTSSGADNIDEYLETIVEKDDGYYYVYGGEERPLTTRRVTIPYQTLAGIAEREFTIYESHRGPIVRESDGKWVSVRLMEEPLKALTQSYTRTKARSYAEYLETMRLHTNSSNNTVFADSEGNIAYFHSNFVPVRETRFDFTRPVDGSDPATDWNGVHAVEETPGVLNPETGWIQNTNNWPYSVSGSASPRRADYPSYMSLSGENPRGVHAVRLLSGRTDFTLESLIEAAYDSYLPAFDNLIPGLVRAYDATEDPNVLKDAVSEEIDVLRDWDFRWSASSVPTALAIYWAEALRQEVGAAARVAGENIYTYMERRTTPRQRLEALAAASERLTRDFGTWRTPWGDINRFQRLTGDIVQPHDDDGPSIPVGFVSGQWGSLASFGTVQPGTRKRYGTSGNSFVAVVEFGDSVRAKAVTAGGLSGNPASPHFDDQAGRYATGDLRDVYYYRGQLEGHIEREYHPGG